MMGVPYDTKKSYIKVDECHECGEKFKKHETLCSGAKTTLKIYDDPWALEPSMVRVHANNDDGNGTCLDKLTDTNWADFRYFVCADCGRTIIRQCPYNGWRSYVKERDGEEVCVACYQTDILTNGHRRGAFEGGLIAGDFYDSSAIGNHDWVLVQSMQYRFVSGRKSAGELSTEILALMDSGKKVLVDYESMAQGGGEGSVSVYIK